jgi:hypothetical protein
VTDLERADMFALKWRTEQQRAETLEKQNDTLDSWNDTLKAENERLRGAAWRVRNEIDEDLGPFHDLTLTSGDHARKWIAVLDAALKTGEKG